MSTDPTVEPTAVEVSPRSRTTRWIRVRMLLCMLAVVGLFGLVARRAYRLQLFEGDRLRQMAEEQYLKQIELPPRRGTIFDRHGAPLAVSVDVDSIYANPRMIGKQAPTVAASLAPLLDLEVAALTRVLGSQRYFAWVKRRVPREVARRVEQLKVRGLFLTKESRRFYPSGDLAAGVVGFAGLDARGLEGVEHSYDAHLRGRGVRVAGLRDALGRQLFTEGWADPPSGGHDLVLSIDKFIQYEVQQAIAEAHKDVRARTGWIGVVALDPQTGDVLAVASTPGFDPNHYGSVAPEAWRNRTITDTFEPGSTLKVFSVASAMQAGKVRAGEVFDCEKGRWRIGKHVIHDTKPQGYLSVSEIMTKSSNIGVSKIALRMGKRELYRSLRRFGFGRAPGLGLRGERAGVLRDPKRWSDVGLANIAFGQGMTTTVMHLASALTAIANGGRVMQPRLVLAIRDAQGRVVRRFDPQGVQVLRRDVADTMRHMLVNVTRKGGTGTEAATDRFSVAGKTGTAQKVDPATGTYSRDRWLSSFIGLAPANKPRLVLAVVVNEPGGDKYYGGEVAGPIFRRIAERTLRYLGVRPDQAPVAKKGQPPERKKAIPIEDAPPSDAEGDETSEAQHEAPTRDNSQQPGQVRRVGNARVPDFTGMTIGEALGAARQAGLQLEVRGTGRAVAQQPGPGPADPGALCRVAFQP